MSADGYDKVNEVTAPRRVVTHYCQKIHIMRASEPLNRLYTKPLGVRVSNEGILTGVVDVANPGMTGRTHLHTRSMSEPVRHFMELKQ